MNVSDEIEDCKVEILLAPDKKVMLSSENIGTLMTDLDEEFLDAAESTDKR